MGKYTAITSECLVPMDKANYVPMSRVPPLSAQIVIGTPGTIRKYILNGKLGLSYIKILVFDEADLMLDDVSFFLIQQGLMASCYIKLRIYYPQYFRMFNY